jgi:hypothetical protein
MGLDAEAAGLVVCRKGADPVARVGWTAAHLEPRTRGLRTAAPLSSTETTLTLEVLLPLPALAAWDWLLSPDKRELWEEMDISSTPRPDRRPGTGTRFRSRHGKRLDEFYEVMDWKPFREWTWDVVSRGRVVRSTVELHPDPAGTRVVQRYGVTWDGGGSGAGSLTARSRCGSHLAAPWPSRGCGP